MELLYLFYIILINSVLCRIKEKNELMSPNENVGTSRIFYER